MESYEWLKPHVNGFRIYHNTKRNVKDVELVVDKTQLLILAILLGGRHVLHTTRSIKNTAYSWMSRVDQPTTF